MAITTIMANSIWPNGVKVDDEGFATFYLLGTNKIEVPTSDKWPVGDRIVSPFVYQGEKLVGFCDTEAMTVSDNMSITLPYTHIEANFSSIAEGMLTVNAPNATVKKFTWAVASGDSFNFVIIDFNTADEETINTVRTARRVVDNKLYDADNNLIGTIDTSKIEVGGIDNGDISDGLFCNFDIITGVWRGFRLSDFNSDLSSLRERPSMFFGCANLTSFTSSLPNLTNGNNMFSNCQKLTSFSSDLSSLTHGITMFNGCHNLDSFNVNLSSLTDGNDMFSNCEKLTSFSSDLSSLTNGYSMFDSCTKLTSFNSDLSSLTDGLSMFYGCKLDAPSIKNIIDTINTYSAKLTLGMGCDNTTEDKNLFAQEVGYTNMTSLLTALQTKGWTVTAQYNGRPTTTYGLRRPSEDTLPVFVKLEETEKYANYTSQDGSKKFRLDWFHETNGSTEGYTQYTTLEEAIETLNIKPIERN